MISETQEKRLVDNESFMSAVKETLDNGYDVSFTVTGMSMWPFLTSRRDSVVIKKCDFKEIKKGDIVLFSPEAELYLLHRVTGINENSFQTTGDCNCFRDGFFSPDTLIARVETITRKGKSFSAESKAFVMLSKLWASLFPIRAHLIKFLKHIAFR